ncbi:hypothetical protein Pcinc_037603 [Petrolisthes cinctipes]|uniref:Uncharacterized protein n=1 Tax=Petrolisthes cinctipes TaxID=88211 RepID=A0AAE1ENT6_PETCI|nr:hypothetical protein Pcinc_037603 [Petrolisthes cinctipes]
MRRGSTGKERKRITPPPTPPHIFPKPIPQISSNQPKPTTSPTPPTTPPIPSHIFPKPIPQISYQPKPTSSQNPSHIFPKPIPEISYLPT